MTAEGMPIDPRRAQLATRPRTAAVPPNPHPHQPTDQHKERVMQETTSGPFGPYVEVARAEGAWKNTLLLDQELQLAAVRGELSKVCHRTRVPMSAQVQTGDDPGRTVITLYRDPSTKHRSPDLPACSTVAAELARALGARRQFGPADGIMVGLGLVEGFGPHAPVHDAGEALVLLGEHGVGECATYEAQLVSARRFGAEVRWAAEPGLVITTAPAALPAIAATAAALRQVRFSVTDFDTACTYALKHSRQQV